MPGPVECPRCQLLSPSGAGRCDCGYLFGINVAACQRCGSRPATPRDVYAPDRAEQIVAWFVPRIFFARLQRGRRVSWHLCDDCARVHAAPPRLLDAFRYRWKR